MELTVNIYIYMLIYIHVYTYLLKLYAYASMKQKQYQKGIGWYWYNHITKRLWTIFLVFSTRKKSHDFQMIAPNKWSLRNFYIPSHVTPGLFMRFGSVEPSTIRYIKQISLLSRESSTKNDPTFFSMSNLFYGSMWFRHTWIASNFLQVSKGSTASGSLLTCSSM